MSKLTISEAVRLTGISESTLRRAIKSGKVSAPKDDKGHRRIDVAELERVYDLQPPPDNQPAVAAHQQMITLLEGQVADLKDLLDQATDREKVAQQEKAQLLELLTAEKEEKRALMPPPKAADDVANEVSVSSAEEPVTESVSVAISEVVEKRLPRLQWVRRLFEQRS